MMNTNNDNKKDKFIASILLFLLGDTIGFKNGSWITKYSDNTKINYNILLELLYEFIDLGGINGIDLNGWNITNNSLMLLEIGDMLIENNYKDSNECLSLLKKYMGNLKLAIETDQKNNIFRGFEPEILDKLLSKNVIYCLDKDYDIKDKNNESVLINICIGLLYSKDNSNIKMLVEKSIIISKLFTCSPMGYLAGLTSALFTCYAIQGIDINKWPFLLIEVLESDDVKTLLNSIIGVATNATINITTNATDETDYNMYLIFWKKYIDFKFEDGIPIHTKMQTNIVFRHMFYTNNFSLNMDDSNNSNNNEELNGLDDVDIIGYSGISCIIMAYDCLIDSTANWEKLIIYSALHIDNSNSIASVASALYGAYYGWGDIPKNNLKYIEYKNKAFDMAKKLYATNQKK